MPGSINGIGTMYYGRRDPLPDGSYITTSFFCVLFIPILPLHSLRVIPDPKNSWHLFSKNYYLVLEKRWPNPLQVISIYLLAAAVITMAILYFSRIQPFLRRNFPQLDSDTLQMCVFFVCALTPVALGVLLRRFLLQNARAKFTKEGT